MNSILKKIKYELEDVGIVYDYGKTICTHPNSFDRLYQYIMNICDENKKYVEQLTKAKEIIEELSKSLFLAKGLIRDLIDDTVDFKESKERAIYCYEQEYFDIYKGASKI